jgi:cytochrome oxidase Cu insertion factor (SCO1/SenC/PrrC family)
MKLTPRAKLLLIAALFALPIVASLTVYRFFRPEPTANYGELILPPQSFADEPLARLGGASFRFGELRDRWILVASDAGACDAQCAAKLYAMRQVRLALGRNASRVARVFVVDDGREPEPAAVAPLEELIVAVAPRGMALAPGAANDRAHIYLVDPRGNVMMRWPARPDLRGMLNDLERLLKASQIG